MTRRALSLSGRAAAVVLVALASLLLVAGPASAHAELVLTNPLGGATLLSAPREVVLTFSEPVEVQLGAIVVRDSHGDRVDVGDVRRSAGSAVRESLRAGLGRGVYLVIWRVVSDDGHPITGSFSFGVGASPGVVPAAAHQGSRTVGVLRGASSFAGFVGLVLLVGGGAFVTLLWPAGGGVRRVRRLVWAGWWSVLGSSVVALVLQGPYGEGKGLASVADLGLVEATLQTRSGRLDLVRLLLLGLAVPLLRRLGEDRRDNRLDLGALGVVLLVTYGLTGHAGAASPLVLAVGNVVVHLAAMSLWVGGLVVMVALLSSHAADLVAVLPRFSRLAFWAVVTLLVTGTYQSWREVGTLPALPHTAYGRVLFLKLGGFVVLVGLGWLARRWIARHFSGPPGRAEVSRLRRSLVAEVGVVLAVLGLTAVLIDVAPAWTSYAPDVAVTRVVGPVRVHVAVSPTRPGSEVARVSVTDAHGAPVRVAEITGTIALPAQGVQPLDVAFVGSGVGRAETTGFSVPLPGRWTLALLVKLDDFTEYPVSVVYRVR